MFKIIYRGLCDSISRNLCIPDLTPADHFFARSYYAVTTPIDAAQTVAKIVKAIFAGLVAAVFFGSSRLMNECHIDGWKDVAHSAQMTMYSLFGIIDPKRACLEKVNLDLSKGGSLTPIYALAESSSKTSMLALKALTFGSMMESMLRVGASLIRWGFATGMYTLSGGNAPFTGLLADGARFSVENACNEVELCSLFLSSELPVDAGVGELQ